MFNVKRLMLNGKCEMLYVVGATSSLRKNVKWKMFIARC